MANILPQITHIVVVMFENRSLDNMCGWIYPHQGINPSRFLPAGSPAAYDGLNGTLWNPSNRSFFNAAAPVKVSVVEGTTSYTIPHPDPEETSNHFTCQICDPENPDPNPA